MGNYSQVIPPNRNRKPHKGEDVVKMAMVLAKEGGVAGKVGNQTTLLTNKVESKTLKGHLLGSKYENWGETTFCK